MRVIMLVQCSALMGSHRESYHPDYLMTTDIKPYQPIGVVVTSFFLDGSGPWVDSGISEFLKYNF